MRISIKQLKFLAFSFACASFLMAGCSSGNIHTAAFDGDLAKVKQLVASGVDGVGGCCGEGAGGSRFCCSNSPSWGLLARPLGIGGGT